MNQKRKISDIILPHHIIGYSVSYLMLIILGALLLSLPVSLQEGQSITIIDALFTAASAVSVTGLTSIVVGDVFSRFGLVVLLLIIQVGGIGLMFLIVFFWLVIKKNIGFSERNMIMTDQNQFSRKGMVKLIRNVLIMFFWIELIGFIIIANYLYFAGYFNLRESLFQALFLTISLTANAGFDIAPNRDSFQMFSHDYFMQSMAMILMLMGSIGFWVLSEFKEFIHAKRMKKVFKFSYFVRMLVFLHLLFVVLGALFIFVFEFNGFLADKGTIESIYYAFFMSITTRNAGFSTMDVNEFSTATSMIIMMFMFIGASPNSYGGGIRTTSIVVIILSIRAFAVGKDYVIFNNRKIKNGTVHKAYVAFVSAIFIVFSGVIVLSFLETQPLHKILFEVTSAYGTTGLSMGITSSLHGFSKLVLVITMFIGRLGILALVMMIRPSNPYNTTKYQYPEENIIVG